MAVSDDEHLLDTCVNVVCRFKLGYAYGSRKRAIQALKRRAPGFAAAEYEDTFDALCTVYDKAAQIVAQQSDAGRLSFEDCRQELLQAAPSFPSEAKTEVLRWVICEELR